MKQRDFVAYQRDMLEDPKYSKYISLNNSAAPQARTAPLKVEHLRLDHVTNSPFKENLRMRYKKIKDAQSREYIRQYNLSNKHLSSPVSIRANTAAAGNRSKSVAREVPGE